MTELIFQAVARQQRVLVCAPSNIAVDNILEKIVNQLNVITSSTAAALDKGTTVGKKKKTTESITSCDEGNDCSEKGDFTSILSQTLPRVLRLGHPARISESILHHCLDSQIRADDVSNVVLIFCYYFLSYSQNEYLRLKIFLLLFVFIWVGHRDCR